ncbi:hypothetical protein ACIBQX_11435 [Nonomuraea sp. NPDC049714]|uniref:hypothetical protein n=1 Tax=Nonomuraea sp. NPDC049714 TaxID=3364357 RepID=UPI0037BCA37E
MVMREEYDRERHGPYGEWLKSKGVQTRAGGWTNATRDQVLVDTPSEKRVLDQLGNEVRQYGSDRQDVTIKNLETVRAVILASAMKKETTDVQQR